MFLDPNNQTAQLDSVMLLRQFPHLLMIEIHFDSRHNKVSQDVLESHWGAVTNGGETFTFRPDFILGLAGDLWPPAHSLSICFPVIVIATQYQRGLYVS